MAKTKRRTQVKKLNATVKRSGGSVLNVNVIEHLWAHLENQLKKYSISNRNDLIKAIKEEFVNIDPAESKN
ncbi:hypothetical protein CVS40_6532 [Lucilia cuprina]|nr:hypothetical protein CVS40_6532 [Lucilia cuprina]